jgi:hypothetical protein
MKWSAPSIWEGGECIILAGGSSVPYQFSVPENIIQAVMDKVEKPSAYSPFLKPIHNKHIIGINNAYQIGNWIDVIFFGDCAWYLTHQQLLSQFSGLKVTCCKRFANKRKEYCAGIKYLEKDKSHKKGISRDKEKVSWNSNSGGAAISLAVHFGVKRIILLGFDMRLNHGKRSHWHGSHGKDGKARRSLPFPRHLKGFPFIAEDAKTMGVEILNASPDSAITEFPKVNIMDVL